MELDQILKIIFRSYVGAGGGSGGTRASALTSGLYSSENPRRVSNYGLGTGSRLGVGNRLGGGNRVGGGGLGVDDLGLGLDGGYGNILFRLLFLSVQSLPKLRPTS